MDFLTLEPWRTWKVTLRAVSLANSQQQGLAHTANTTANKPVLILDGPSRTMVAVARSLASHGIPVDAAHFEGTAAPGLRSRTIRQRFLLSDWASNQEQFLSELIDLIDKHGYDMVIPASDTALTAVSYCYEKLSRRVHLGCPAPKIAGAVLNKAITLQAAAECGIPIPRTWGLADLRSDRGVRFPLVCKPKVKCDTTRFGVTYVRSRDELKAMYDSVPDFESSYVLQEYCPGAGVAVEVLLWEREPVAVFQHRRIRENPARGGVSVVAESESVDPILADMAVRLLRHINWSGPAMVEFRRDDETGDVALMEINGRPWGSLALPCRLGVEFPYFHWQLLHGEQPVVCDYQIGARMRWTVGEVLRMKGLAADCFRGRISVGAFVRDIGRACLDLAVDSHDMMSVKGDRLPGIAEMWFLLVRRLKSLTGRTTTGGARDRICPQKAPVA
jgi:predicted ATP-grasp superfamily ATP-dependent carboligase